MKTELILFICVGALALLVAALAYLANEHRARADRLEQRIVSLELLIKK